MNTTTNNQHAVEAALAAGNLWALMGNGRYWRLRRNGATKTWKTRPGEFRIPVKAGLKACGEVTHNSRIGAANPQDKPDFVVMSDDPNLQPKAAKPAPWTVEGGRIITNGTVRFALVGSRHPETNSYQYEPVWLDALAYRVAAMLTDVGDTGKCVGA